MRSGRREKSRENGGIRSCCPFRKLAKTRMTLALKFCFKTCVAMKFVDDDDDDDDSNSCRSIALTSTLCKIMRRPVTNRLVWYFEEHSILTNVQTGFRKSRSTVDQIILLPDEINRNVRNRSHAL